MSAEAVYCRNCGFALAPNDKFCNKCGAQQPPVVTDTRNKRPGAIDSDAESLQGFPSNPRGRPAEDRKQLSAGSIGCGALLALCLLAAVINAIWGNGSREVDLHGTVRLYGDMSTFPAFGESCAGTDDFSFVKEGASVEVAPQGADTLSTKLSRAVGGEHQQCEISFGGTVQVADEYEVAIYSLQDEISVTCAGHMVTVYEFDHQDDIAFMKINIEDGVASCAYGG